MPSNKCWSVHSSEWRPNGDNYFTHSHALFQAGWLVSESIFSSFRDMNLGPAQQVQQLVHGHAGHARYSGGFSQHYIWLPNTRLWNTLFVKRNFCTIKQSVYLHICGMGILSVSSIIKECKILRIIQCRRKTLLNSLLQCSVRTLDWAKSIQSLVSVSLSAPSMKAQASSHLFVYHNLDLLQWWHCKRLMCTTSREGQILSEEKLKVISSHQGAEWHLLTSQISISNIHHQEELDWCKLTA